MEATARDILRDTVGNAAGGRLSKHLSTLLAAPDDTPSMTARELIGALEAEGASEDEIAGAFSGACEAVLEAMPTSSDQDALLKKTLAELQWKDSRQSTDCLLALVTFFCGAVLLDDPRRAAANVVVRRFLASGQTAFPQGTESHAQSAECSDALLAAPDGNSRPLLLALARCHDNVSLRSPELLFLDKAVTILGRSHDAGVSTVGNDPTVSRIHLLVRHVDSRWLARGLGSRNGSSVRHRSGKRETIESPRSAKARVDRELALSPGDILCLGLRTHLRVIRIT